MSAKINRLVISIAAAVMVFACGIFVEAGTTRITDGVDGGSITVDESTHTLVSCDMSVTSVVIPDGVEFIGPQAFYFCNNLTSVTIPRSVKGSGNAAFAGCTKLTEVHIEDVATYLGINYDYYTSCPTYYGANLYLGDEVITDLEIPSSVTAINYCALYNCKHLTKVTIKGM